MEFDVNFTFTREPSTKISVEIVSAGLVAGDNTVVLIGQRGAETAPVAEIGTIDFTGIANGAAVNGTFFNAPEGPDALADGVAFWYDTDDSGTTIPAGASTIVSGGGRAVEITTVVGGDTPAQIATKTATAMQADAAFVTAAAVSNVLTHTAQDAEDRADAVDGAQATGAAFAVTTQGSDSTDSGTAPTGEPELIENFGDLTALQVEVDTKFGAGSVIGEMVVAAANAVLFTDLDPLLSPPVKAIPLDETVPDLVGVLAANEALPMPFAAIQFSATDSANLSAFKDHLVAISKSDRGVNGQFGSFGYVATRDTLGTVTPIAEGVARQEIVIPYLRDSAVTPAQADHKVAAAMCALQAANIQPFNPLNDIKVGGLVPPVDKGDFHTPGDSGTVSVALAAGTTPFTIDPGGNVLISRTITASRRVASIPDPDYFDVQDWRVLYLIRKNAFNLSQQKRYKTTKASVEKASAFRTELLVILRGMETLGMLQFVDELADQVTVARDPQNRAAFIYTVPVNVIPGFHNKGIGLIGTTLFDATVPA